jgi:hypothetical protein
VSAFPVHDWQFWVVTGVALVAALWLLRAILPIPWIQKRRRAKRTQHRATLTVEGRTVAKGAGGGGRGGGSCH